MIFEEKENVMCRHHYVLEGDWGGQVYMTIPAEQVKNLNQLQRVLRLIDNAEWGDQPEGARIYTQCLDHDGEDVCGGMGGGKLTGKLWLHPDLSKEMKRLIPQLLAASRN